MEAPAFSELVKMAVQLGVFGTLVLWFVWDGSKRQERNERQQESREQFIREELMRMNREVAGTLQGVVTALQRDTQATEEVKKAIENLNAMITQRLK